MSRNDDLIIAHTRRELELAGAFDVDDGILGKAILAVMKTLQHYAKEDQNLRESIGSAVDILARGGLLSEPTNDPAEWLELKGKEGTWSNRRNPFFVSSDGGQTWHHLISKQEGKSKEVIDADTTSEKQGEGSGDTGRAWSNTTAAGEGGTGSAPDDGAVASMEEAEGLEAGAQQPGVQSETDADHKQPKGGKKKPSAGKDT